MLFAALKILAVLVGLGLVGLIIWLLVALARMAGITVLQWRDLMSLDRWQEVLITVGRNKLRTALTTISVAWGILVLVFLLGLGRGLENGMQANFGRDATNSVWMRANKTSVPHGGYDIGRRLTFDNRDFDRAKALAGIDHISGEYRIKANRMGAQLTRRGAKANAFGISAVHADAIYLEGHDIVRGRFLTDGDIRDRRKAVVIGRAVAQFLFGAEDPIGDWINIVGVPFQVVGVFADPGGNEEERQMYIPVSTAQLAYNGGDDLNVLQFTVGQANAVEAAKIIEQVKAQLAEHHQFSAADPQAIRVQNNVEQFERFSKLFWMISTFVTVIGLGTLAAGVVGVSNIMMIAVKERTKEIGVRKAIGATPRSIIFMIIQESVFLTGVAGLLGLSAGVGLLELAGKMNNDFIVNPGIDLSAGVAAAVFLVIAGALAGYFPARAAAKVNPIHALRDQ